MNNSTAMVAALLHLLASSAPTSAQETPSDNRLDRLPVSISIPLAVAWAPGFPNIGYGFAGVSLSTRISAPFTAGLSVRHWDGYYGPDLCAPTKDQCAVDERTSVQALLPHVEFYPFRGRLGFVRGGAGIARLRKQEAVDTLIHETGFWRPAVVAAAGWDLRLTRHLFATPVLEVLWTGRVDPAQRSSPEWVLGVGVALTVR